MNKVYVVTRGSYSDYMIERVFCDKHKAELFATYYYDAHVEEYDLADELVNDGREYFHVGVVIWFTENRMQMRHHSAFSQVLPDCAWNSATIDSHFRGEYMLTLRLIYSNQRVSSKAEAGKLGEKAAQDFATFLQNELASGATTFDLETLVGERNKKYEEEGIM